MLTPLKQCRKCLQEFPATLEFFYKNAGGKYGVTPRCKSCVNKDNKESAAKRDPAVVRAQANVRSQRHYYNNLDKCRQTARDSAAKARQDPEKRLNIQSRKRAGGAGLTPEQIEEIRTKQDNLCAICGEIGPTDLDHCHATGTVRFLLCKHCNRGLGAFRDRPDLMRKAANLLEAQRDRQQTQAANGGSDQKHGSIEADQ